MTDTVDKTCPASVGANNQNGQTDPIEGNSSLQQLDSPTIHGVSISSSAILCPLCNSSIHHKSLTVSCVICTKAMHITCLISLYRQSNGDLAQLKNNHEWLTGFIGFHNLHYTCTSCRVPPPLSISGVGKTVSTMSGFFQPQTETKLTSELAVLQSSVLDISGCLSQLAKKVGDIQKCL